MTKHEGAAAMRQGILAYLRRNPGAPMHAVARYMHVSRQRAAQTLARMEADGETRRADGGTGLDGKPCACWFAVARNTRSAASVRKIIVANLYGGEPVRADRFSVPAPRLFGGL